jgi:ATP-dependent helicase/nuclease subunit B
MPPQLYSVPMGQPFLPTLVQAVEEGALFPDWDIKNNAHLLSDMTLFLPTQRAVRDLTQNWPIYAQRGGASFLPRPAALGELDDEMQAALEEIEAAALSISKPIAPTSRLLTLAPLVMTWSRTSGLALADHPTAALALAKELASLMDRFATERIELAGLSKAVPDHLSQHWQITLEFLQILQKAWPAILLERGCSAASVRRDALLKALAQHYQQSEDTRPILAAGSTGSIPATQDLLRAIASRPNGAVVLPYLDRDLDEGTWQRLSRPEAVFDPFDASHPQALLARLLSAMGAERGDVKELGTLSDRALADRQKTLSMSLLPSGSATELWQASLQNKNVSEEQAAFEDVTRITAKTEQEEAAVIALILRETLEHKHKTAALITPDRTLARRVEAELARFDIEIDDSAGRSLNLTKAGVLAHLIAEAALMMNETALKALLCHPYAAALWGNTIEETRARDHFIALVLHGGNLEAWKGNIPQMTEAALAERTNRHAHPVMSALNEEQAGAIMAFSSRVYHLLEPLMEMRTQSSPIPFAHFARTHAVVLETIMSEGIAADHHEDVEALEAMMEDCIEDEAAPLALSPKDYPAVLKTLMSAITVRRKSEAHPRLSILGLPEARLMHVDRVILGGMTDGVWPPQMETGPFINRSIMTALGMVTPERRVGLSAHDYTSAMGMQDVIITHAAKRGGNPVMPSRFLQRLDVVLSGDTQTAMKARGDHWLAHVKHLDQPQGYSPAKRPAPCPPKALRLRRLSVTAIEKLRENPYHIYASHILKIKKLAALGGEEDDALFGTIVHAGIETVLKNEKHPFAEIDWIEAWQNEARTRKVKPEIVQLWQWRLKRMAGWLTDYENDRTRDLLSPPHLEKRAQMSWSALGEEFTLSAKADRLDVLKDGTIALLDYKTGTKVPSIAEVKKGRKPQLTLEAAIQAHNGFSGLENRIVSELSYIHTTGRNPPGEAALISDEREEIAQIASETLESTKTLMQNFMSEDQPFHPYPRGLKGQGDFEEYLHLSRHSAWSLAEGDDEGEEAGSDD